MTARIELVLVRTKEDGNVGATARVAKNFGAERLALVAPRAPLGAEARRRSMAGLPLLRAARRFRTVAEALDGIDLVVGTTDLSTGRSTAYLRRSVSPERLGEMLVPVEGRVALLLGPEDNGLSREELGRCDVLVHVPARREFPTLNVSHAAAIVLYAIHRAKGTADPETTPAPLLLGLDGREKELFLARVGELLARIGYPAHKRKGLILLFRRVLGRSTPTEAEYRMMLGLFHHLDRTMARWPASPSARRRRS
ncbi:MAG TPA: TrmH family RNA methyltransferase [Thermoplasmata archaeon]|nr:TrmH family RNA methyltransferase [Thermoplasmata archaeon]